MLCFLSTTLQYALLLDAFDVWSLIARKTACMCLASFRCEPAVLKLRWRLVAGSLDERGTRSISFSAWNAQPASTACAPPLPRGRPSFFPLHDWWIGSSIWILKCTIPCRCSIFVCLSTSMCTLCIETSCATESSSASRNNHGEVAEEKQSALEEARLYLCSRVGRLRVFLYPDDSTEGSAAMLPWSRRSRQGFLRRETFSSGAKTAMKNWSAVFSKNGIESLYQPIIIFTYDQGPRFIKK